MKDISSKTIILLTDLAVISGSLTIAYYIRFGFDGSETLLKYLTFPLIYLVVIALFTYEGIYTKRYDFWHESRQVSKALMLSFLIVLSVLALTNTLIEYSRAVITIAFLLMFFLIPIFKILSKHTLFKIGWWQRQAEVIGNEKFVQYEIFNNPYIGYVKTDTECPKVLFLNSYDLEPHLLRETINKEINDRHEVIFIPVVREFDMTHSHIYQISNARANLVVLRNRLKSKYRLVLKQTSDIIMSILLLPLLVPILLYISYRIKKEDSKGSIVFAQERMGKDGNTFTCYKFRTMYEDADDMLVKYLNENPQEVENYAKFHKYENDPRITKIGDTLRRTSLDELPQIFNVLKGEMSFIGPRPFMLNEKAKIGEALSTILMVRPGITGLWQVSGRSDIDFHMRVKLDVWYIRNWNLWMNFVILMKTVGTVLFRKGAS